MPALRVYAVTERMDSDPQLPTLTDRGTGTFEFVQVDVKRAVAYDKTRYYLTIRSRLGQE